MLPINKTYFLFTVYMLFYFTFFFHNADVCIFAKTTELFNCLIIFSYKTNPSFSPCPWSLRSIGPSDFKLNGTASWTTLICYFDVRLCEKKKERAVYTGIFFQMNFRNVLQTSYCKLNCTICSAEISYLF